MESIGSELEERLLLAFSLRELEIELRATRSYAIPAPSGIARPWNIREPLRLLAAEWNEGETHPFQTILLSRDNNDFLAASHAIACESEKKNACMEQRVCIRVELNADTNQSGSLDNTRPSRLLYRPASSG